MVSVVKDVYLISITCSVRLSLQFSIIFSADFLIGNLYVYLYERSF